MGPVMPPRWPRWHSQRCLCSHAIPVSCVPRDAHAACRLCAGSASSAPSATLKPRRAGIGGRGCALCAATWSPRTRSSLCHRRTALPSTSRWQGTILVPYISPIPISIHVHILYCSIHVWSSYHILMYPCTIPCLLAHVIPALPPWHLALNRTMTCTHALAPWHPVLNLTCWQNKWKSSCKIDALMEGATPAQCCVPRQLLSAVS